MPVQKRKPVVKKVAPSAKSGSGAKDTKTIQAVRRQQLLKMATVRKVGGQPTGTPAKRVVKKKEAPKFEKPGQRYATPEKTDPLYKFYTSLLKQNPKSEMALKWCLEHGVLPPKKATELLLASELKKKAVISDKQAVASPSAPVAAPKRIIIRK